MHDSSIKTAVVCMVYNGLEYISEFIHHYLNICDHLYIIDHNSQIDLRQFSIDRVSFVRSNHEAQFQSECTNLVIEHFDLKQKYDWIFVLDIDEFLPFYHREDLQQYLRNHKEDLVIQCHWANGVPFYDQIQEVPSSLIDCPSIRFFYRRGIHYKSFVNVKKTGGKFFVPTGAHHIAKILSPWHKILPWQNKFQIYSACISDLPLYHVVAFNKSAFVKKIKNYVQQMSYREHMVGQGGWVVRDYPEDYTDDEWLWYIGNFRVSDSKKFYSVTSADFVARPIFYHLPKEQVIRLREKILAGVKTDKRPATNEEKCYLAYKKDDREVMKHLSWFRINDEQEIVSVPQVKE